jgi:hypothetical protein
MRARRFAAADGVEEARRRTLLGEEPGSSGSRGRKNGGGDTQCWEEQIWGKRSGLQWGCRRGCGTADGRQSHSAEPRERNFLRTSFCSAFHIYTATLKCTWVHFVR